MKGVFLGDLSWIEAEPVLTPATVLVIPLGAAAKEHGPHLPLNNDLLMAERLARLVAGQCEVVVVPTVAWSYYPAFTEYPGSVSLKLETATELIVEICQNLARFGARRFYVLNTGISTIKVLSLAAERLKSEGLAFAYTDLAALLPAASAGLAGQEGGSHADEIETSMMLWLAPEVVHMSLALKEYRPGPGPLTRVAGAPGVYSQSGIWGDPTLATAEKGQRIVEHLVRAIVVEIDNLRTARLT